jgi:diaminopimelate epimerase
MKKKKMLPFIKMEGAGNDFVFISRSESDVSITKQLAQLLLNRHYGIGGDQLLVINTTAPKKEYDLAFFNSDGSMAEMCGNGVRSAAHYLKEYKGAGKSILIHTKAGPIQVEFKGSEIDVDMGQPILEGTKIPVKAKGPIVDHPFRIADQIFRIHAISMGNPHCVIFVQNLEAFPVHHYGPMIENHPFFPKRVNVEFVEILNNAHVKARVWERGAGETLACGSGACAIAVAGARFGLTSRKIKIDLPGGRLGVRWAADNHVFLTGPARVCYQGVFLV